MSSTMIRWCVLCLCVALFQLPQFSHVLAEGDKPYLSQQYIDTMVQNAYYGFVSAAEYGSEQRQKRAIAHAKSVASRLKRMAQGDPNRRYVFWRVADLELQIYLEEEEIILKKMYKMQKKTNILCDKFNAEVGKRRPNFVNLIAIHAQMLKVNPRKADELAWLIEDRDRNISREIPYSIEKALLALNYDKAIKEFEYIRKNRKYLMVSDAKYESFERRIRAKQEADDMVANVGTYLGEIKVLVERNRLSHARRSIEFLQSRIKDVRNHLPYAKYSKFTKDTRKMAEMVTKREDSLVVRNLELIHARRTDAAIDYLDNVLRKCGVANEKIAMVNKAIMELPDGYQRSTKVDQKVNKELLALSATSRENGFSFTDVNARIQAKMDSVKACQAEQARLAQLEYERTHKKEIAARRKQEKLRAKYQAKIRKIILKIYTCLEQNKLDKAQTLFAKQRRILEQYASREEYASVQTALRQTKDSMHAASQEEDKNREKARQVTQKIYSLLRKNQPERAYSKFTNLQKPLQHYSSDVVFAKLETEVNNAYNTYKQERQRQREQQRLQEQEEQSRIAVVETPRTPATVHQPAAVSPTPATVHQPVAVSPPPAEDPYAAFDKKQADAEDKAMLDVMEIYSLLEKNRIDVAYRYFKRNRIPLKTYIIKEAYDVLESTVVDAYNSFVQTMR